MARTNQGGVKATKGCRIHDDLKIGKPCRELQLKTVNVFQPYPRTGSSLEMSQVSKELALVYHQNVPEESERVWLWCRS